MARAAAAATRGRAAAPARKPRPARATRGAAARPARPSRQAAVARKAIRVVPRGGTRPAAHLGVGVLDRLLRGRAWIACIGALLTGVVFLNVSLLEINRGITQKAERAAELKRGNAQLRLRVAELASSERIQQAAAARGFVLPPPGDVRYVESGRRDAERAAQRITAPSGTPAPAPTPPAPAPPPPAPQSTEPHTHAQAPAPTETP